MKFLYEKLIFYGPRKFLHYFFYELYLVLWMRIIKGSYSQSREDLIIDKLLQYKKKGFYVDIGAYDPNRFNNTKRFYKRGWRGINIEPDCGNYKKFTAERRRDINLNIGISNKNTKLTFYQFNPDTLSTFLTENAKKYQQYGFVLKRTMLIPTNKLSAVLEKYAKRKYLNFMTIDTEGFELQVLQSNNWIKFGPEVLCIETGDHDFSNKYRLEQKGKRHKAVGTYMMKVGYKEVFWNGLNSIFIKKIHSYP